MPDPGQWWGYDFTCDQSLHAIHAAFHAAGPWQWQQRDSDALGDYLQCRPSDSAKVRVYEYSGSRPGDREGFYAELVSDVEARPEIDRIFRRLLQEIGAKNITET
jgi:hypothetical protein